MNDFEHSSSLLDWIIELLSDPFMRWIFICVMAMELFGAGVIITETYLPLRVFYGKSEEIKYVLSPSDSLIWKGTESFNIGSFEFQSKDGKTIQVSEYNQHLRVGDTVILWGRTDLNYFVYSKNSIFSFEEVCLKGVGGLLIPFLMGIVFFILLGLRWPIQILLAHYDRLIHSRKAAKYFSFSLNVLLNIVPSILWIILLYVMLAFINVSVIKVEHTGIFALSLTLFFSFFGILFLPGLLIKLILNIGHYSGDIKNILLICSSFYVIFEIIDFIRVNDLTTYKDIGEVAVKLFEAILHIH